MAKFIKGLQLNRMFYKEVVGPLMKQYFPELKYSAGLVGHGSDVLGFDTEQSMDHNWGPHLVMFFSERDFKKYKSQVDKMLQNKLPREYKGFSTHFTPDRNTYLRQRPIKAKKEKIRHLFTVFTVKSYFKHYLSFDPYKRVTVKDWLTFPQQALLEVTAGELFHDDLGLEEIRKKFAYYPNNVWKYMYHIQWDKIANQESFMGRTGVIGDELGSHIIATQIVQNIMMLCFLMERKYMPYSKWFGTAFSKLEHANKLQPLLLKVVHGKNWKEREKYLVPVYEFVAREHNKLKITRPMQTKATNGDRPFKIIWAHDFAKEVSQGITYGFLKGLQYPLGSIDQFISHTRINHVNNVYTKFKKIIS